MAKQTDKQKETELIQFGDKQFVETFNQYEAKQRELVEQNPFIEVVDNETWEIGKQRRTALRTGRTTLENESKEVVRKINGFKDWVKKKYSGFVEISVDAENKQQQSVKDFEAIKEAEKQRQAELEQERTDEIRRRIDHIEGQLDAVIQKTTVHTIEGSKGDFDDLIQDAKDQNFDELEFLMNEAIDRQRAKWNERVVELKEAEQRRLDELKVKQQSLINELFVQATTAIDHMEPMDPDDARVMVDDIFTVKFDFGDFESHFQNTWSQMVDKAKFKAKELNERAEQAKKQQHQNEIETQRDRIIHIREGLLDLVFQMNVDNRDKQTGVIKSKMNRPDALFPELVKDWDMAMDRVTQAFNQKMEMIDLKIEKHGMKVDQREKELIAIGFEKNDNDDLTLDDAPDWTLAVDTLWNMSDDEFGQYKSDVQKMLDENKIHNQRWDARKPEVEKMGFEYHENDQKFIHSKFIHFGFPLDQVLTKDDEQWNGFIGHVADNIENQKKHDKAEKARQKKIRHDKSNLTEWINHAVRKNKANIVDLAENKEMKEFHHRMVDELNAWCDAKIDQIEKF